MLAGLTDQTSACSGIVVGRPLEVVEVEEDEVGPLAHLERADLVIPAESARPVDRGHPQRLTGSDLGCVEPRVLEQSCGEVHLPHQVHVPGGRDAVGADAHGDAAVAHLGILADRGRALRELERGRRAERDLRVVLGEQRDLGLLDGNAVSDDEVRAEAAERRRSARPARARACARSPWPPRCSRRGGTWCLLRAAPRAPARRRGARDCTAPSPRCSPSSGGGRPRIRPSGCTWSSRTSSAASAFGKK